MTRTPNLLLENLVVLSLPLSFIFEKKRVGGFGQIKKRKTTLLNEKFFLYITYTAKNNNELRRTAADEAFVRTSQTYRFAEHKLENRENSSMITFSDNFYNSPNFTGRPTTQKKLSLETDRGNPGNTILLEENGLDYRAL